MSVSVIIRIIYLWKYIFGCSVGTCDALSPLPNGRIWYGARGYEGNDDDGYPVGTPAQFFCNDGYTRQGSWRRICRNSLQWDESTPHCKKSNEIKI